MLNMKYFIEKTISERLLWLIQMQFLFVFIQYASITDKGAGIFGLIDDSLSIVLLIIALSGGRIKSNVLLWSILLLSVYMLTSWALNSLELINLIMGYRAYFIYVPTFLVIYYYLDDKERFKLLQFIWILWCIEFIIALGQISYQVYIGDYLHILGDSVHGTLSGGNNFGYALLMIAIVTLVFNHSELFVFTKKIDNYLVVTSFIMIFLVESRGAFIAFIVSFFVFSFIIKDIRKLVLSKVFLNVIIGSLIGYLTYVALYNGGSGSLFKNNFSTSLNPKAVFMYEQRVQSGSNRLLWFPLTYEHLQKYAYSPLVGLGPATHSSHAAHRLQSPIAMNEVFDAFGQSSYGMDGGVDSQIIPIWGEYGHIGILMFYGLFLVIFIILSRRYYYAIFTEQKMIHLAGMMLVSYYVLLSWVNHVWEAQVESILFGSIVVICISGIQTRNIDI